MRSLSRPLFLLLFLILALTGCSATDFTLGATATPTLSPATPTPEPTPTPVLPGVQGGLKRILERGSLIVGWQAEATAPFLKTDDEGSLDGLDVLLADALARRWFNRPNTLVWRQNATINDLSSGRVDLLMGGLPHTRASEAEIDFSQTYWMLDETPIAIGVAQNDSLLRDLVNATLQELVDDGSWNELVRATTGAPPVFTPERWQGMPPDIGFLAASSQPEAPTRLIPGTSLSIAFHTQTGFVEASGNANGYLPDLARELNRRLTGNTEVNLVEFSSPPPLSFNTYDIYLGPQLHDWSLEHRADFSQNFYADGLALIARPGSKVERLEQLQNRPTALIETENSRHLYDAAVAESGITPILFPVADGDAAVALLVDNKIDAILIQGYPAARLLAARVPNAVLTPGRHGPTQPFVIALPSNDSPLRDAINLALQDMLADGALAQLHSRYFGGDPPYPIERW